MLELLLGKYIDYPCSLLYCCSNIKQELMVAVRHCINVHKLLKITFHFSLHSFFLKHDFPLMETFRMIIGTKSTYFSRAISSFIIRFLHWSMLIPDTDVSVIPRSIKPICTLTEHWIVSKAPGKSFCEWFPSTPILSTLYFHTYLELFLHESVAYIRFYDIFLVHLKR